MYQNVHSGLPCDTSATPIPRCTVAHLGSKSQSSTPIRSLLIGYQISKSRVASLHAHGNVSLCNTYPQRQPSQAFSLLLLIMSSCASLTKNLDTACQHRLECRLNKSQIGEKLTCKRARLAQSSPGATGCGHPTPPRWAGNPAAPSSWRRGPTPRRCRDTLPKTSD